MRDLRERLARLIGPAIRHHDRVLCPDAKYLAGRIVDLILVGEDWLMREAAVAALRAQGLCSVEGDDWCCCGHSGVFDGGPDSGHADHCRTARAALARLDAAKEEGQC